MSNPESPNKNSCRLYLPMSFNPNSRNRLTKLIQSPNNIHFYPNHQIPRCHQKTPEKTISPNTIYMKIPLSERKNRFKTKQKKDIKWSISRMLEKTKPQLKTIHYISKLYKYNAEKQVIFRKSRERSSESQKFTKNILQFQSIKLKPKEIGRDSQTADKKCRYHHSQTNQTRTINTSDQQTRIKISKKENPYRKIRKTIAAGKPENWAVESWNISNKYQNVVSQI